MSAPLFTVIVPTYSRPQMLAQTVASIQRQTVADFECIIVDDAGLLRARAPDDSRFRVIRREDNGGQGASFNTGIHAARGKYIAFLDDDDLFTPQRLEIALEGFSHATIAVCLCRVFGDGQVRSMSRRRWYGDLSSSIRERPAPQIGMTAICKERAVLFDERLPASADVEWWIRMSRGNTFHTIERLGLLYRLHDTPRHKNGKSVRVESLRRCYELHRDYFDQNPRATSYHFQRVGINALNAGRISTAAHMLTRSFLIHPNRTLLWTSVKTLARCAGAKVRPSRA